MPPRATRAFTLSTLCLLGLTAPAMADPEADPAVHDVRSLARESALRYVERAALAERAQQPLDAESLYRRAMEVDPAVMSARLAYARLLDARGHHGEAVQVLAAVSAPTMLPDEERVALARGLVALTEVDRALSLLRDGVESERTRATLVELAAAAGRFPEALAAARRQRDGSPDETSTRRARVLVRALTRLVAEADAVTAPPHDDARPPALRRTLADDETTGR